MTNLMAEAETKQAHTPDWSVVGPDLLAALQTAERYIDIMVETSGGEYARIKNQVLSEVRAAIQRAEA